jgi:hypothetical protein
MQWFAPELQHERPHKHRNKDTRRCREEMCKSTGSKQGIYNRTYQSSRGMPKLSLTVIERDCMRNFALRPFIDNDVERRARFHQSHLQIRSNETSVRSDCWSTLTNSDPKSIPMTAAEATPIVSRRASARAICAGHVGSARKNGYDII